MVPVKEWFGESGGVRVRRSNASRFTCVLCSEIGGVFLVVVVVASFWGFRNCLVFI